MPIRCSVCNVGTLRQRVVPEHDVSALVGLDQVTLVRPLALVCNHCGATTVSGEVLESILPSLARTIVEQAEELRPKEVRFLRELLGLTQEELAERLGLKRLAIHRWESGEVAMGRLQSLAMRSLVAWHLGDAKLARRIAALRPPSLARTVPPYRIERERARRAR